MECKKVLFPSDLLCFIHYFLIFFVPCSPLCPFVLPGKCSADLATCTTCAANDVACWRIHSMFQRVCWLHSPFGVINKIIIRFYKILQVAFCVMPTCSQVGGRFGGTGSKEERGGSCPCIPIVGQHQAGRGFRSATVILIFGESSWCVEVAKEGQCQPILCFW